jgi:hypothetical protein
VFDRQLYDQSEGRGKRDNAAAESDRACESHGLRIAHAATLAKVTIEQPGRGLYASARRGVIRAVLLLILLVVTPSSIAHAANDKDKPKPKPPVSTFLARCKSDLEVCTDKISDISPVMVANVADQSWCPTVETDDVKIAATTTVEWLTNHPELAGKPIDDGIKTALRQLYPCKR